VEGSLLLRQFEVVEYRLIAHSSLGAQAESVSVGQFEVSSPSSSKALVGIVLLGIFCVACQPRDLGTVLIAGGSYYSPHYLLTGSFQPPEN